MRISGGDSAVTEGKVQARASGAGLGQVTWAAITAVEKERWLEQPATGKIDVSAGRSAGSLRRCGGVTRFLEVLVWRCRARLPNVVVSFLKYLMSARTFVVGALLVKGPSSGK